MRLIDADAFEEWIFKAQQNAFDSAILNDGKKPEDVDPNLYFSAQSFVDTMRYRPTVDAIQVIRCRDCIFWKPRHIKLNDGSEREYLPGEGYVGITVGINVGSQCMVDEYSGYGCDKSVFRRENDFCSRGKRKMDAGVNDGKAKTD